MTIDFSKPVRLKGNKRLMRIFTAEAHGVFSVVGEYAEPDAAWVEGTSRWASEYTYRWKIDGTYRRHENDWPCNDSFDLENVPEEPEIIERWANLFENNEDGNRWAFANYKTLQEANIDAELQRDERVVLASSKVTFVIGKFEE